jgi:hypothetical protein
VMVIFAPWRSQMPSPFGVEEMSQDSLPGIWIYFGLSLLLLLPLTFLSLRKWKECNSFTSTRLLLANPGNKI